MRSRGQTAPEAYHIQPDPIPTSRLRRAGATDAAGLAEPDAIHPAIRLGASCTVNEDARQVPLDLPPYLVIVDTNEDEAKPAICATVPLPCVRLVRNRLFCHRAVGSPRTHELGCRPYLEPFGLSVGGSRVGNTVQVVHVQRVIVDKDQPAHQPFAQRREH